MPGWARTKRHVLGAPAAGTPKKGSSKRDSSKAQSSGTQDEGERSEVRGLQPRLLAMDCEMCETDREHAALVGLCVSDEKGEVLYKALVRPRGTIVNLRTELTGITTEDLETVLNRMQCSSILRTGAMRRLGLRTALANQCQAAGHVRHVLSM
eukprot:1161665-Pelagomonas_calceolata.AAC.3